MKIQIKALLLASAFLMDPVYADPLPLDPEGIISLSNETKGKSEVKINRSNGGARFVNIKPAQKGSLTTYKGSTPKDTVEYFLGKHGKLFGIVDKSKELQLSQTKQDNLGFTQVHYKQVYKGIPVYGGVLVGNVNKSGELRSLNGRFIPLTNLNTTPTLTSTNASNIALKEMKALAADSEGSLSNFTVKSVSLVIYNPSVTQDKPGKSYLGYLVNIASMKIIVDAQTGFVLGKVSTRPTALSRRVYDAKQAGQPEFTGGPIVVPKTYPNQPYWIEGNAFPTSTPYPIPDFSYKGTNDALAATKTTYDLYKNTFGIDAPDGRGTKMDILLNYSSGNAFAATDNYPAMFTGYGIESSNDDTVGHEWQHWYTNFAGGGLDYLNQAGALNESYSDIIGETVDILNAGTPFGGTDTPFIHRTDGMCSLYNLESPDARTASLVINSPTSIAGEIFEVALPSFGPVIPLSGVTGDLVHVNDGSAAAVTQPEFATIDDGCQIPFLSNVSGKIALIKRGNCDFDVKVGNAESQGAIGVVIYNRVTGVSGMGGSPPPIVNIPSLMVSLAEGQNLIAALETSPVNVTLKAVQEPRYVDNTFRWVLFEDDGGAPPLARGLRDMWEPTCLGQPGKISDPQYFCGGGDNEGVHTNSGVPNHAFALLVDGGSYNGVNVGAIGLTKAVHIYQRAQFAYQTFSMNFADHADALVQACSDLTGQPLKTLMLSTNSSEVINNNDCMNVEKAMQAVEMRQSPNCLPQVVFSSIAPVTMLEGNTGTKPMVFTIRLSAISELPVTVRYEAVVLPQFNPQSDADNGTDYLPTKGEVVIPPGSQEATFSVPIKGDTLKEGDERFMIYTNAVNATISGTTYGVIINDD